MHFGYKNIGTNLREPASKEYALDKKQQYMLESKCKSTEWRAWVSLYNQGAAKLRQHRHRHEWRCSRNNSSSDATPVVKLSPFPHYRRLFSWRILITCLEALFTHYPKVNTTDYQKMLLFLKLSSKRKENASRLMAPLSGHMNLDFDFC